MMPFFTAPYAAYDSTHPVPPPMPKLNGGLYTGEPFAKDAPYANVPVIPDAGYMTHHNLASANPPPEASTQYPGGPRPGNNFQPMPGIEKLTGPYSLWCPSGPCASADQGWSGSAYVDPMQYAAWDGSRLEGCPIVQG